jgi:hypothetical protein
MKYKFQKSTTTIFETTIDVRVQEAPANVRLGTLCSLRILLSSTVRSYVHVWAGNPLHA